MGAITGSNIPMQFEYNEASSWSSMPLGGRIVVMGLDPNYVSSSATPTYKFVPLQIDSETGCMMTSVFNSSSLATLCDVTSSATGSVYLPSATGFETNFNSMSLSGYMESLSGSVELSVWVSNDGSDWARANGYDVVNSVLTGSVSITTGSLNYAIRYDDLSFYRARIKLETIGEVAEAISVTSFKR